MRKLQTVDLVVKLTLAMFILLLFLFSVVVGQFARFVLMLAVIVIVTLLVKLVIAVVTSD